MKIPEDIPEETFTIISVGIIEDTRGNHKKTPSEEKNDIIFGMKFWRNSHTYPDTIRCLRSA